jgi:hypothetical protein
MPELRGGYPFPNKLANDFAQRFAADPGEHYGCCVATGTIALVAALQAAGLPDDFPPLQGDYRGCRCPVSERAAYDESVWLPQFLLPGGEQDVRRRQKAIVCATAAWPGAC